MSKKIIKNEIIKKYIEKCSNCGLCKEYCPLYLETKNELYSPRGIIAIIKNYIDGNPFKLKTDRIKYIISKCHTCYACVNKCPANIDLIGAIFVVQMLINDIKYDDMKFVEKIYWTKSCKNRNSLENFKLFTRFISHLKLEKLFFNNHNWFKNIKVSMQLLSRHEEGSSERYQELNKKKKYHCFMGLLSDYFFPEISQTIINDISNFGDLWILPYNQLGSGYVQFLKNDIMSAAEIAQTNINAYSKAETILITSPEDAFMWKYGYNLLKELNYINFDKLPEIKTFLEYYIDKGLFTKKTQSYNLGYIFTELEVEYFKIDDKAKVFFDSFVGIKFNYFYMKKNAFSIDTIFFILENNENKPNLLIDKWLAELSNENISLFFTSSMELIYYNKFVSHRRLNNLKHISEFVFDILEK